MWGAELLKQGIRWRVKNSRRVFFWQDIWLGSRPLSESLSGELEESLKAKKMSDYWVQGSDWKWDELQSLLSMTDTVQLASRVLRLGEDQVDTMGWLDDNGGNFPVKFAYQLACSWPTEDAWSGWRWIWKLRTPQRVRVFTRLLTHGKMLTNLERWRRKQTDCPRMPEMLVW